MTTIQEIAKEALEKMRQIDSNFLQPVVELENVDEVNILILSGEFCQPRLRNTKDVYSLVRRKK